MLKDLLYVNEHTSCVHYVSDHRCYFRYYEFPATAELPSGYGDFNSLIFLVEGEIRGNCNEFENLYFKAGDIIYLPKHSDTEIKSHTDCKYLSCMFEVPHNVCDKLNFHNFAPLCDSMEYKMAPGKIVPQMAKFVETLIYYLRNGINCEHFHELKQNEMFFIFRWFYSKQELAELFYPMVGRSLDFKAVILGNYQKVNSVNDLANIVHMGRSNFDATFKSEFGMPPGQWLLKQKAKHIRYDMANPEITISDVIQKYNFNSHTHFTRFCKQQFGTTPSELITAVRTGKTESVIEPKD